MTFLKLFKNCQAGPQLQITKMYVHVCNVCPVKFGQFTWLISGSNKSVR